MRKLLARLLMVLLLATPVSAQIIGSYPFNLTNGTTADATQVMSNFNFIVSQTNANAANAGANSNITAITGLLTPLSSGQGGSQVFTAGTSTGTANAQVVASGITPTGFSLVGKNIACFIAGSTNTSTLTLNYNGTGVTNVFKRSASGPIALAGGEVVSGNITCVQYDGTQYELQTLEPFRVAGKQVSLASAATTDLGTAATNNVKITGTVTITALGSSAQADYPLYFLQFSGALTLTQNAVSLILPGAQNIITAANDSAVAQYLGSGNWQIMVYQRAAALSITVQSFTTGSGATYTPTAGTVRARVRLWGAGGGGGATITNAGGNGATSSFGSWTSIFGQGGGTAGAAPGIGGTGGVNSTGTLVQRIAGGTGTQGLGATGGALSGNGGSSAYGTFVTGWSTTSAATGRTATSCGGGGAGGGPSGNPGGSGGGGGEFVEFWMTAAQIGASQTYTVGAAGTGGTAGTFAGGAGFTGCLVIEEWPF
jgi:hypothetical protein